MAFHVAPAKNLEPAELSRFAVAGAGRPLRILSVAALEATAGGASAGSQERSSRRGSARSALNPWQTCLRVASPLGGFRDVKQTNEEQVENGIKQPSFGFAAKWERFVPVFRYLMVGGLNTAFGYSAFAALNYLFTDRLPFPYMFANVIASVFSISFAFFGYKYFVFRSKGNFWREYFRTYVVYGGSTVLGLVLLPMLVFALGFVIHPAKVVPYIAQALCTVVVVFGSYFGHKKFSFRA
jgi:putative flippase GtrA